MLQVIPKYELKKKKKKTARKNQSSLNMLLENNLIPIIQTKKKQKWNSLQ